MIWTKHMREILSAETDSNRIIIERLVDLDQDEVIGEDISNEDFRAVVDTINYAIQKMYGFDQPEKHPVEIMKLMLWSFMLGHDYAVRHGNMRNCRE